MNIVALITEALKLANNLNDPAKRKEMYRLHLRKKAKKALEYAERTYHLLDATLWNQAGMKKSKEYKKYKYLRKQFFKND